MTGHIDPETLAEFREGLLSRRRAAQVSAHLAACARCAESERGLAGITALLASAPPPPMPAGLSARIEAALAAEAAARAAATPDGIMAGEAAVPSDGPAETGLDGTTSWRATRPGGTVAGEKAEGAAPASGAAEPGGGSANGELAGTGSGTISPKAAGTGGGTTSPETAGMGGGTTSPEATGTGGGTTSPEATGTGGGTTSPETAGIGGGTVSPEATGTGGGTVSPEATGTGGGAIPRETIGAGGDTEAEETGRTGAGIPVRGAAGTGHRGGGRGTRPAAHPPAAHPPAGRPPAGPRRHRRAGDGSRPRSWAALRAGAIAAAAAVIVGGGYGVAHLIGGGAPAGTTASGGSSAQHSAERELAPNRSPGGMGTAAGGGAGASEAGPPVVRSGTRYQPGQLGTQVKAVLAPRAQPLPTGTSRAKESGLAPFDALKSLPACVRRVSGGVRPRLVDVATYQGRPAAVIVLPAGPGRVKVVVVRLGCTGAASDVLARASVATGH